MNKKIYVLLVHDGRDVYVNSYLYGDSELSLGELNIEYKQALKEHPELANPEIGFSEWLCEFKNFKDADRDATIDIFIEHYY